MKRIAITLTLILSLYITASAQGFTPPSEGKAVVHFTRVTSFGALIGFDYFDGDRFIGAFAGKKYMRYECEPGDHLFWASSENKAFMTASLEAGKSYVVIVDVVMGVGIARVGLAPIGPGDKLLLRARSLIQKKAPVTITPERIASENRRLASFIREKLDRYESAWKNELEVRHLSADMAVKGNELNLPEITH